MNRVASCSRLSASSLKFPRKRRVAKASTYAARTRGGSSRQARAPGEEDLGLGLGTGPNHQNHTVRMSDALLLAVHTMPTPTSYRRACTCREPLA